MKRFLVILIAALLMVSTISLPVLADDIPVINYLRWDSFDLTDEEIAEVEEKIGAKLNITVVPFDEYYTKLNTLIAAGQTPDVFEISEYLAVEWGEKGLTTDLVPLFNDLGINLRDTYLSATLYGAEDKVYGITSGLTCIMLFYNKDLFDKYDLPYPSNDPQNPISWDEYVALAQKLTFDSAGRTPLDDGFDPYDVVTFGTKTTTWTFSLTAILFSNGTGMFADDGMALAFDNDAAKEVLSEMCKLSSEYKCAPDAVISASLPGNVQMFKDGLLGMCVEGSFMIASYVNEGANFGVCPLPSFGTPATATWSAANAIAANTEHPVESAKFLEILVDRCGSQYPAKKADYEPEAFAAWADRLGLSDAEKAWMPGYINSDASKIHEAVYIKNYGTIIDEVVSPELDKLFSGEIDVDQFAAETAEKAKGMFGGAFSIIK